MNKLRVGVIGTLNTVDNIVRYKCAFRSFIFEDFLEFGHLGNGDKPCTGSVGNSAPDFFLISSGVHDALCELELVGLILRGTVISYRVRPLCLDFR